MPYTPHRYPNSSMAGIRNKICRDRESRAAGMGLPMAWKKMPVTAPAPIMKQASRYTRKHFTANSMYRSDSCPNRLMIYSGQNWKMKKAATKIKVQLVRASL